ncbi:MAG TPA: hypothetical protein VJZ27_08895 [Aggregatilineales bacterium]|nr:hypothetical protein [Aggregatilineales bacterium]
MNIETVINNEHATLSYHCDSQIVHHVFHKQISGQAFRDILNAGVELMEKNKATKWLSDDRNNSALPDDDTEWSLHNWFPRAQQAGWKFWALVVPPDILARFNLKEFVDSYYEQGLRIMVFTDPAVALTWLEHQQPV